MLELGTMFLTIDAGNTSVHFGVFQGRKLLKEWRLPTDRISGHQIIRKRISGYQKIRKTVVSSVVPRVNKTIRKWFPQAIFVSHKNIGIKVKVKHPAEVGADRLVDALAAYKLYGGPAIVVDFGTATTFDVVSARGDYLGGAIAPGILLARDALHAQTAKLPKIEVEAPRGAIGKNTLEAMRSGLVYGYVAMVEGMIRRLKSEILNPKQIHNPKFKIKVVATGGLAKLICKHTRVVDRIDTELTLKGLRLLGEELCLKN